MLAKEQWLTYYVQQVHNICFMFDLLSNVRLRGFKTQNVMIRDFEQLFGDQGPIIMEQETQIGSNRYVCDTSDTRRS